MDTARTKTIFWVSVSVLTVLLTVTTAISIEALGLLLGYKHWDRHGGAAGFPCFLMAIAIVYALFRRLGLIESERYVETLRRSLDAGPVRLETPVEVRTPRSLWMALAVIMDVIAILILILVLLLPAVSGTKPMGYGVAAFFVLSSLVFWYGYVTHAGLIARVDKNGIQGELAKPKSSVKWSEVASCEITAVAQPWGTSNRFIFQDAKGKVLMQLVLSTAGAEQERFLATLRECFAQQENIL